MLTALGTAACVLVQRGVGSLFRRRRALALALGGLSAIALVISGVLAGSLPYQLLSLLLQVFCAGTTLFGGRRTSAGEAKRQGYTACSVCGAICAGQTVPRCSA